MGLLEMIFGPKKEPAREIEGETISMAAARKILYKRRGEIADGLLKNSRPKYSDLQRAVGDLEGSLSNLAKAQHGEEMENMDVNQRILSAAIAGRRNFVDRMGAMVRELKKPLGSDVNSVMSFHDTSSSLLKNINDSAPADYRFFGELFSKEAAAVLRDFERVTKLSADLGKVVSSGRKELDTISLCELEIDRTNEMVESVRSKKTANAAALEKTKELENEGERLKNEILKLSTSDEAKELEKITAEKESTHIKMSQIQNETRQLISSLEKVVKKFRKMAEEGGAVSVDMRYVGSFLENPVATALGDPDSFKALMSALEKLIVEGKIGLDKTKKSLELIKSLANGDAISKHSADVNILSKELQKLDERMSESKIQNSINRLKSELESVTRNIAESEAELPKETSSAEKLITTISEKKAELEARLGDVTGRKIKLSDFTF